MVKLKYSDYVCLFLWIGSLVFIGTVLGFLSKGGMQDWYSYLEKSYLTPPSFVFRVIWPLLYIIIGFSGWIIWKQKISKDNTIIKKLYGAQLILNWIWTPLFLCTTK